MVLGAAAAWLAFAGGARAESDLLSPGAFHGLADLRGAVVDGEPSWLDGGFGKLRFGAHDDGAHDNGALGHVALADAALAWTPRLSWELGAVIDGEVQKEGDYQADLIQAYLQYKPVPRGPTRYEVRAGLFYPPISEEHSGPHWEAQDVITPSAINTWVGEEVKVVGAEATVSHAFGDQQISATGALFGFNDTSGTLLTFRGWSLDDIKGGAFGKFDLPPLERQYLLGQPPETYPLREVDGRVGFYGRVEWRTAGPASFNAFYYDNNGDLTSKDQDRQWSWDTRFWNFGARLDLDENTKLLSQLMTGQTLMGFPNGRSVWFNVGYTAAYVLASHSQGPNTFTGRVDYFETSDRNVRPGDDQDENWGEKGWSITGAYKLTLSTHANLLFEALHVESNRPTRLQTGYPRKAPQTLIQSALRVWF